MVWSKMTKRRNKRKSSLTEDLKIIFGEKIQIIENLEKLFLAQKFQRNEN